MKTRITTKDPAEKVAHKRLSVLQLAEALGNVSEACKRSGMDRTSYYAWKKRYTEQGLEGLKDLPPHRKEPPPEDRRSHRKAPAGAVPGLPRLGLHQAKRLFEA
jgi:transposase-like protein